jgi:hypothetical protein
VNTRGGFRCAINKIYIIIIGTHVSDLFLSTCLMPVTNVYFQPYSFYEMLYRSSYDEHSFSLSIGQV